MKTKFIRIAGLLLAVLIIFSGMPVSASAEDLSDVQIEVPLEDLSDVQVEYPLEDSAVVPVTAPVDDVSVEAGAISDDDYSGNCYVTVNSFSFIVPYGQTVSITWEYDEAEDGWMLCVNGDSAKGKIPGFDKLGGFRYDNGSPYNYFKGGEPEPITFSPSKEDCENEDGVTLEVKIKEQSTPEPVPPCVVSVNGYTIEVPAGSAVNVTWEFIKKDDVPFGWAMLINGDSAYGKQANDTLGGFMLNSVPDIADSAVICTAVPEPLSFTPTEEQSKEGKPITLEIISNDFPEGFLNYTLHFITKETGAELGSRVMEVKLSGYGSMTEHGASYRDITNYVSREFPGYRVSQGNIGSVDMQEYTVIVDENGCSPKDVNIIVEVNHNTLTPMHTQPVEFVCNGKTVYKTDVPCDNRVLGNDSIKMDMSKAAKDLENLGFILDTSKEYTVVCNGYYPHDPAVSIIEVMCSHKNTELNNVKEPSCTEDGYTGDTVCSVCGQVISKGDAIPALGHKWSGFKDNCDSKTHCHCCERCGVCENAEHIWNSGVITRQPSDKEKGEITYTCTECGCIRKESFDKNSKPKTGDESQLSLWLGLLAVSGTAAAVLVSRKWKID